MTDLFTPSGGKQRLRQRSEYRAWELDEFDIPQRHSRSVYKLGLISERYRWLWSLTVKGYEIDTPEECDRTQNRLKQLLRDAYKRWGIRFLLKREFDLERGRHWPHWHIYSPDPLPEEVEAYLRQGVLRMHRAKNNKRQIYKFKRNQTPEQQASCEWYAGKVDKTPKGGGARPINTIYPPKGWSRKLKCRAYALIGLSAEGPASSDEQTVREVVTPTEVHPEPVRQPSARNSAPGCEPGPRATRLCECQPLQDHARDTGNLTHLKGTESPRYERRFPALCAKGDAGAFPRYEQDRSQVRAIIRDLGERGCVWFKHHGNPERAVEEASRNPAVLAILRRRRAVYCALPRGESPLGPPFFLRCMKADTDAEVVLHRP